MEKQVYEAPELEVHEFLEELTQGNVAGAALDATYANNTPQSELTFS